MVRSGWGKYAKSNELAEKLMIDYKEIKSITINGVVYNRSDIVNMETNNKLLPDDLLFFLKDWFNDSPFLTVQTSGSTGLPKEIQVEKSRMLESAKLTCEFLGLKEGDTALLCMNLKYIGAKMVVVRSLLKGLNLIYTEVNGYPLKKTLVTDFAAMTPMQVFNSLQDTEQRAKLRDIRHLIIGGGAVDEKLKKELAEFPHAIWSTYGMTETLSHIALRRINGSDASDWYTPFDGVSIGISENQTLIIDAPLVAKKKIFTNDIVEINKQGQFRILGRLDNVINSGGIKIQIEEVENLLKDSISTDFVITSAEDVKFGEIVVLLVKEGIYSDIELSNICKKKLPTYWVPKKIFQINSIPHTDTNKPNRNEAKIIAKALVQ